MNEVNDKKEPENEDAQGHKDGYSKGSENSHTKDEAAQGKEIATVGSGPKSRKDVM